MENRTENAKNNDNRIVDGFQFTTAREAKFALDDVNRINKIKYKINTNNPTEVYKLYIKLVEKKYFSTPVGLNFMREMREFIISETGKDVPAVPVPAPPKPIDISKSNEFYIDKVNQLTEEKEEILRKKKNITIAMISLLIVVVGMFFIMATNNNVGYFNAEEKVLNKYAAWEERLSNWEEELNERELQLEKELNKK